ncbi:MAG: DNA repair protein Rad50 [Dictyoglomaceae bacterium]
MKAIDKKIIDKILQEAFENIFFPFSWGKETLKFLYYYQKGEEKELLRSFQEVRDFQNWGNKHLRILEEFIEILNGIKDFRPFLLIKRRELLREEREIINLTEDIKNFIEKNKIPLSSDLLTFPKKEIGIENYLWEILTWYLKASKFITFSINFNFFPELNSTFIYEGERIYQLDKIYFLKEEKNFLSNLLINLSGFPSKEGIKKFSLPYEIILKESHKDFFILDSQNFNLIFHLS